MYVPLTPSVTWKMAAINNRLIEAWDKSGVPTLPMPLQGLLIRELQEGLLGAGMTEYLSGLAGQASGMITEVKPAARIVEDIVDEAIETLGNRLPAEVNIAG